MARIAIYIGRHLCTAPRPCKEADALSAAGHDVTVSGLWSDPRLIARDKALLTNRPWRFVPYVDCSSTARGARLRWLVTRLQHRVAREWFIRTGRPTANVFGYGTAALADAAIRRNAELSIFHSEGGMWAARRLHQLGRRVGMDFEDWFSRDLPPSQRTGRPIAQLARLEREALRFGAYVTTTSQALAQALATAYAAPAPAVIYNTFPAAGRPASQVHPRKPISLHWFSQILGPGRGLETLFRALPRLTADWELHLRADDPNGYAGRLLRDLPLTSRHRVRFEPTVPNQELPARIAEHDIGLALDPADIPSRNLTVTNKLFEYLLAGLAVVASNTAGHTEVLDQAADAGEPYVAGAADSLADALTRLMNSERLARAKQAARAAGTGVFAHERQIPIYAELAERALTRG